MSEEAKDLLLYNIKARLESMGFSVDMESEASEFLEFEERPTAKRIRVCWDKAQAIVITRVPLGESPGRDFEDIVIRNLMSTFGGLMKRTRKMLERCHAWLEPRKGPSGPSLKFIDEIETVLGKRVFFDEEFDVRRE